MGEEGGFKDYAAADCMLRNDPNLLRELVEDPEGTLAKLGVCEDALHAPKEAIDALERAKAFSRAAEQLPQSTLAEALSGAAQLAANHFGEDYEITKEPFGLKFAEKTVLAPMSWTATGSGTITWSPMDTDTDVDG